MRFATTMVQHGYARFRLSQPGSRVVFNTGRICGKSWSCHERIGFVVRVEAVDLKFHLIPIKIRVVHRDRHAVMNTPIGCDPQRRELFVVVRQVIGGRAGVRDVVDANQPLLMTVTFLAISQRLVASAGAARLNLG